jgi:hypothetical protein
MALLQHTIENFRQNTTLRWEGVFRLAVWLRIAVRLEVDDVTHFVCEYFADAYGSTPGLLFGDAACNTLRAVGQTPLVRARRVDAYGSASIINKLGKGDPRTSWWLEDLDTRPVCTRISVLSVGGWCLRRLSTVVWVLRLLHGSSKQGFGQSESSDLPRFRHCRSLKMSLIKPCFFAGPGLQPTPTEESLSQLTHRELLALSFPLWGKSPETQSCSSSSHGKRSPLSMVVQDEDGGILFCCFAFFFGNCATTPFPPLCCSF